MEYLQKNFSPCAWCEKYGNERMVWSKKGERWLDDEVLFRQLNLMPVSHTICPECNEKTLAEIDEVLGKGE